jgi:hypothetical protein
LQLSVVNDDSFCWSGGRTMIHRLYLSFSTSILQCPGHYQAGI